MKNEKYNERIDLKINGMTCDSCAVHVRNALIQLQGVIKVELPSWKSPNATVIAQSSVSNNELEAAVKRIGYQAKTIHRKKISPDITTISSTNNGIFDYDLAVIGTGGGGMAAAIKGAEMGIRVCIIEKGTIGGTCVNIGCIPSKLLIRAAEQYYKSKYHNFSGINCKDITLDWSKIITLKDNIVNELREKKYLNVIKTYKEISLIKGEATFVSKNTLMINNKQKIKAKKIIIASGSEPRILPIAKNVDVLTSTTALNIKKLPKSLIVIGGRAIALELGQMFARFGTKVTILQRSSRIIPDVDRNISETLRTYLQAEGIIIFTNVKLIKIEQKDNLKIVETMIDGKKHRFQSQEILMAVGKVPTTDKLNLTAAGIETTDEGFIKVNEYLQTTNPNVFAVGDVTPLPNHVYVAAYAGIIAAKNAITGIGSKIDLTVLPKVIFTSPEVAVVGMTEEQALNQNYDIKVTKMSLEHVPRAITALNTKGMIKLIIDNSSRRLLGAHIVSDNAGELIQTTTLLLKFGKRFGATIDDLTDTLFPYLTQVEGIKLTAQTFDKDITKLSCCGG